MARNAYTLTEAQEMLKLCKVATKELLNGQAKSYRVGTREFTALDIQDLLDLTKYYSNLVVVTWNISPAPSQSLPVISGVCT